MTSYDTDTDINMTRQDPDMTSPSIVRVTVEEAAKLLDVSVDAIRKRIERGSLRSEKVDKTRYVLLDGVMTNQDSDMSTHQDVDMTSLVTSMQDQIDTLKRELEDRKEEARRKDAILMTLAQRVPELEAATEPRERSEHPSEERSDTDTPSGKEEFPQQQRSWVSRFFFGP